MKLFMGDTETDHADKNQSLSKIQMKKIVSPNKQTECTKTIASFIRTFYCH